MGVDYGWEKFYTSMRGAATSRQPLQGRLASVLMTVSGLRRESFPDDKTWDDFQALKIGCTMVPAKGDEETIEATTLQMDEREADQWLEWAFDIYNAIAIAKGANQHARERGLPDKA